MFIDKRMLKSRLLDRNQKESNDHGKIKRREKKRRGEKMEGGPRGFMWKRKEGWRNELARE